MELVFLVRKHNVMPLYCIMRQLIERLHFMLQMFIENGAYGVDQVLCCHGATMLSECNLSTFLGQETSTVSSNQCWRESKLGIRPAT